MKKMLPFLLIILAFSCGQSDNNPKTEETTNKSDPVTTENNDAAVKSMFDIKAVKVVFNYTGGPAYAGTETLYLDDYGNIAVLVMAKGSGVGRNNQTMIWKDKKTTIINPETKTVSTSAFRVKNTEPPGIADISDASRNGIGYEKLPDETIAGKNCEVWYNKQMNVKYYLWKKIDLKMENQGVYTKEATSVEEISEIPATVMEIPKDYKQ